MVLMDIEMPIMDGLEATKLIRQREQAHPALKLIPIIGLSAYANAEDRANALDQGMNDYICKPIKAEEIGIKVAYWTNFSLQAKTYLPVDSPSPDASFTPLIGARTPSTSPILSTLFKSLKTKSSEEIPEAPSTPKKQRKEDFKEEDMQNRFIPS
jgi:CheY-like chemotaxis protein